MNWRTVAVGGLLAVLVLVGGFVIVGGATSTYAFVIADTETGEVLHSERATEETTITLEYTHSVEKTRILEVYTIEDGSLVHTEMHFASYGAGLPTDAAIEQRNGSFVSTPNTTHSEIHITPGTVAGHTVSIDGTTHDLVELSNDGSVTICASPYVSGIPDRLTDRSCTG